ncbi:MAG: hypothetical protein WDZ59_12990 [Pirellulales bacterium]
MNVRLVFTGRSYDRAQAMPEVLDLPPGCSLREALAQIDSALGDDAKLPGTALVCVGGKHLGTVASPAEHQLSEGDELVLVAPVAGG